MAEKEQMPPFWYQGYLIDPNEESAVFPRAAGSGECLE